MNQLPGVKPTKSFSHLTPIAPAPLLAPRPVQVLPKPSGSSPAPSSAATAISAKPLATPSSSTTSISELNSSTPPVPCIITSKQWVLPPRPKAGRKPVNPDKKKPQKRQNSMTSVTSNMGNLNIHKSSAASDNMSMNSAVSSTSTNTITTAASNAGKDELRLQLESATQENEKLKSIISWLKIEIEQLQKAQSATASPAPTSNTPQQTGPLSPQNDLQVTAAQIQYQLHGTIASTPTTSNCITPREMSPSTIDPKDIGMVKPVRQKRQYKKKAPKKPKKEEAKVKLENTPSPIAIPEADKSCGLPTVETIMNGGGNAHPDTDQHQSKRCKTVGLERSMSVQTADLLSPSSYALDRTMSAPMDYELNPPHVSTLSRTTTNTTIDPLEFGWPGRDCGFCQDGGPCLCLEKSVEQKKDPLREVIEEEELDMNQLFKSEIDEYDEFLAL